MTDTVYYRCGANEAPDARAVERCAALLAAGGLVVFPTETVYGIGADACNAEAVRALYRAKNRPAEKPLLLHLSSRAQAERVAVLDERARALLDRFTPGPLTLILPKRPCVPDCVTSGGDTVGLRFPSNPAAIALIERFGGPVAATSANESGAASAKNGADAAAAFAGVADAVIDAGPCAYGLESTILSLVRAPRILRQGALTRAALERVIELCG